MKKLIIIYLLLGILFTQELQVEGNLNVTGTIESATIDSLNEVILDLQNQIAGMQGDNRLETRLFTTDNYYLEYHGQQFPVDIQSLIGTDIENALISVYAVNVDGVADLSIYISNNMVIGIDPIKILRSAESPNSYAISNNGVLTYTKEVLDDYGEHIFIWRDSYEAINITLTFAITTQFPN